MALFLSKLLIQPHRIHFRNNINMPKRRVVMESDSDSDEQMPIASKRSRTPQIFGTAESSSGNWNKTSRPNFKAKITELELKNSDRKIQRTNQKTKIKNLEIKPAKLVRTNMKSTLKCGRKNPSHERYMEYRYRHKRAFRSFEKSVGKFSAVPDFDKTIRKAFDRLRLKRGVYLGAKYRNIKLRYKVLAHLYNMSVQRVN